MNFATIPRVTGIGMAAGGIALLLWVLHLYWPLVFILPYVIALCVTAACGIYILLATIRDSYRNPRRGSRIKPIRGFDIAVGLLLAGPSIWGLHPYFPAL